MHGHGFHVVSRADTNASAIDAFMKVAARTEETRIAKAVRQSDVMVIAPSQRLDDLAAERQGAIPAPVRALVRGMGVTGQGRDASGGALASYLLFEAPYTRALIALGEADTMARRAEVCVLWPADRRASMRRRRA